MAGKSREGKRRKNKPSVPGLHVNLVAGALTMTIPPSDEPTVVRVAKIPLATNKLAVQASKPVEIRK